MLNLSPIFISILNRIDFCLTYISSRSFLSHRLGCQALSAGTPIFQVEILSQRLSPFPPFG